MIRLALRVRREDAELVLAELADLAPSGVEERDLGATIEYAVYGTPGELPTLPAFEAAIGDALVEVHGEEVADDWADRWRAFHRPVLIAERLHVRPPWSPPYDGPGADRVRELVVDPGQAFGTGGHGTTRLCLELLVALDGGARGPVLDLGCGSGVLAIAAAQLGRGPVLGLDHEAASVRATVDNAAVNGVTVAAERFDLLRDGAARLPAGDGPTLVLANLLRPLLLRVAADGFRDADGAPHVPDALIASGLLVHEADEVAAAFSRLGLTEADRRDDGEWAALLLRRA